MNDVLNHFERIAKPARVAAIERQTIDDYVAKRMQEGGRKAGSKVSPATINRELRHLKAALRVANDWGYLPVVPKVREEQRIGVVISKEHFQTIYQAADVATMSRAKSGPDVAACGPPPAVWWRALLTFAITTGWRIDEILLLRRSDVNLSTGAVVTRAADNKGGHDDVDYLKPVALDHLRPIVEGTFGELVFFWPHGKRSLWEEFHRIQVAAGIKLDCRDAGRHKCNDTCHRYGFHALRRGNATFNAENMPAAVLQKKMRHKSFTTTLRYIGLADKMRQATDTVYVPEFLKTAAG